jgi:hypothetical protein
VAPRIVWGPDVKAQEGIRPRKAWDYDLFPLYEQMFRDDLELSLVVFRGRYLLSQVTEYRVGRGDWLKSNPFEVKEEEIEVELSTNPNYAAFDEEFRERKRRGFWTGKIAYKTD